MRISLLFILILVLSACSHVSDVDHTTLVEATLEADIPPGHTFFTKELNDSAFSLFQTSNGYGILEFSKQEKDWIIKGLVFMKELLPLRLFFLLVRLHGKKLRKNSYVTVFLGEVFSPDIYEVTIDYGDKHSKATLIEKNERRFWYVLSELENGNES